MAMSSLKTFGNKIVRGNGNYCSWKWVIKSQSCLLDVEDEEEERQVLNTESSGLSTKSAGDTEDEVTPVPDVHSSPQSPSSPISEDEGKKNVS